jgi:hypothetical protein
MDFFKMCKEDFENLSKIEDDSCPLEFKGIVLLPVDKMHDSGYGCFDIIPIRKDNEPTGRMVGGDVLRIYGDQNKKWLQVDLLPKSGLFFIYPYSLKMKVKENLISTKMIEMLPEEQ